MANRADGRPWGAERIQRGQTRPLPAALMSIGGQLAIEVSGFDVIGEVMGAMVALPTEGGFVPCRESGITAKPSDAFKPQPARAARTRNLTDGRLTAVRRMVEQASALGADGVVDVVVRDAMFESTEEELNVHEFEATGVAVRAHGSRHAKRPFTAHMSATDVATLMRCGYVPMQVCFGMSCMTRHRDSASQALIRPRQWSPGEVPSFTDVVNGARHAARVAFQKQAQTAGADAAVMADMTLRISQEMVGMHVHETAIATVTGTAIARWRRGHELAEFYPVMALTDVPQN